MESYLGINAHCNAGLELVADPRHNRLISTSPDKDGPFDALTLAQLARRRYVREVYRPPLAFLNLRLQVRHHYRLNQIGCAPRPDQPSMPACSRT